jgi:toxin ParE1/3/4
LSGFVLSPAAIADIEDIWQYSVARWGTRQAERYVAEIGKACEGLANGTRFSQDAGAVRAGYRRGLAGSHVIWFRPDPAGPLAVVRVLHQSMDPERHL